jgi:hypothetical protein
MTKENAIAYAQGTANKTGKDIFVIYDPSYGETKPTSFFCAGLEEVETFFYGCTVIAQFAPIV